MYAAIISAEADEAEFRRVARAAVAADVPPQKIAFVSPTEPSLLPGLPAPTDDAPAFTVPHAFSQLLHDAVCHRAFDRFALLYDVLWRIVHGERDLPSRATDPAVARLNDYAHNVRRDIHKMHAFLRFRPQTVDGTTLYTAWFEPQHFILRRATSFFVDRFTGMDWLIATPYGTALWKDNTLSYGLPIAKPIALEDDWLDDLWLTYYRTTFNPARLRINAMKKEMPKHYWRNMPETALIPGLVTAAGERTAFMHKKSDEGSPRFAARVSQRKKPSIETPPTPIAQLQAEASACTRCPLHGPATQTVFGEGPDDARLVFVGEQPGDREDIAGRPFVGPAGEVFNQALAQAGISRDTVYVTNAVKHFKYVPRGKRRIHAKPNTSEVEHCKWWLERELAVLNPRLVIAMGGTAALSLAGRSVSVLRERGPAMFGSRRGFITVHPSFLLRIPERNEKQRAYESFVADLVGVRELLKQLDLAA